MAGYEGLSKWLKFACISGGCALLLFLFSACATGWNSTVDWVARDQIGGGSSSPNTAVVAYMAQPLSHASFLAS